jgi:hypothetical protein
MWNKRLLRVLGAIFTVLLAASACGSDNATTDTADADADAVTDDKVSDEVSDDEMPVMSDEATDDHDDGHDDDGADTLDVDPNNPIPEVALTLNETDEPSQFDLKIFLTDFTITPENVDGDPIDNEGHMHLLIDGEKVERFYDLERQVEVPEGEHLVEVELNANNHLAYSVDGVPIRAGMTVVGAGQADHDDDEEHSHGDDAMGSIEEGLDVNDANVTLTAGLAGGTVTIEGDERVAVAVGDIVMIMVSADVDEESHLHGYDILVDVPAGGSAMMLFTADTPGRFELEFEKSGVFIAELIVS